MVALGSQSWGVWERSIPPMTYKWHLCHNRCAEEEQEQSSLIPCFSRVVYTAHHSDFLHISLDPGSQESFCWAMAPFEFFNIPHVWKKISFNPWSLQYKENQLKSQQAIVPNYSKFHLVFRTFFQPGFFESERRLIFLQIGGYQDHFHSVIALL